MPEANEPTAPAVEKDEKTPQRLTSMDAFRGLVMFLLLAESFHFAQVAKALGDTGVWAFLARQQDHVEWVGCVLHDIIQPGFSFLVGCAIAFSVVSRRARGQTIAAMAGHAVIRSLLLVLLGIFLRSTWTPRTNFTFDDTLTQIGLGYVFLFALALRPARDQWIAFAVILVGYWALFAFWPLPGDDFNWKLAGVKKDWPHHLTGFAAHWNKNTNPAWAFDTWFMNLFPRQNPFRNHDGGYCTLNFIPTLATMLLGLRAGDLLRSVRAPREKIRWLCIAGVIGLASGWLLGALGICPVVKRIWTPSWVLFSGGWCLLILAFLYTLIDVRGWRAWAFPLVVLGMNSIAAYMMSWLWKPFIEKNLVTHIGGAAFECLGKPYAPFLKGLGIVLVVWLILYWMWNRKIFLRI